MLVDTCHPANTETPATCTFPRCQQLCRSLQHAFSTCTAEHGCKRRACVLLATYPLSPSVMRTVFTLAKPSPNSAPRAPNCSPRPQCCRQATGTCKDATRSSPELHAHMFCSMCHGSGSAQYIHRNHLQGDLQEGIPRTERHQCRDARAKVAEEHRSCRVSKTCTHGTTCHKEAPAIACYTGN